MMKSRKLPQKSTMLINRYKSFKVEGSRTETDLTTVNTTIISSTHIFNK